MFRKRSVMNQNVDQQKKQTVFSRRKLLRQGGLAAGFASFVSAFGITPLSLAHAINADNTVPSIIELGKSEAKNYIQTVTTSPDYQNFQQRITDKYAGTFSIDEKEATVAEISYKGTQSIVARIPLVGGANHSAYVAMFQPGSFSITHTQMALNTFTSERNIHGILEIDGQVSLDVVISSNGTILHTTTSAKDFSSLSGVVPADINSFKQCFTKCVQGYGFSAYVIGLVVAACQLACFASPPLCLACYGATYLYLGGVGAICAANCRDKI